MKIAVDLGGVVKEGDAEVEGAVSTLRGWMDKHEVIIISKANPSQQPALREWLMEHQLGDVQVFFTTSYQAKVQVAVAEGVDMFIDDKMQVLQYLPPSIRRVWFCTEKQKYKGACRYQPAFVASVETVDSWEWLLTLL